MYHSALAQATNYNICANICSYWISNVSIDALLPAEQPKPHIFLSYDRNPHLMEFITTLQHKLEDSLGIIVDLLYMK